MGRRRIVIVGSGNVATHLAPALDRENDVVQVVARSIESASRVSALTRGARPCADISEIEPDADFYIVSVNDDAVGAVAEAMPRVSGVVAHTSGSVPMGALEGASARVGVFYPLQTFSREATVEVERVPFLSKETHRPVRKNWLNWPALFQNRLSLLIPTEGRCCTWRLYSPVIFPITCGAVPTGFSQMPV